MTDRLTVGTITSDALDDLYERVAKAEHEADTAVAAAAHLATLVGKRSEKAERTAEKQRRRADLAETELRVLRTGLRANGADPTQIQNLWAQIRLRNRQWREENQRAERAETELRRYTEAESADAAAGSYAGRAEKAEAAIARVRTLAGLWAKRTDQLKRGAELLALALNEPPGSAATQATEADGDPDTRCGDPYRTEHHGVARCSRGLGHPGIHAGHADDGTPFQWPALNEPQEPTP